jgi:hypothetical protein
MLQFQLAFARSRIAESIQSIANSISPYQTKGWQGVQPKKKPKKRS